MNVFKRVHDIVSSNVNSALDKMEDPKKMINLMISEMEETEIQLRTSIAGHTAELDTLSRQIREAEEAASRWAERAALAVGKDNDDLAREAIAEKNSINARIKTLKENASTLENIITSMKEQLEQIDSKLEEMKAKRSSLTARAAAAKEKIKTNETIREADSVKYTKRFEELQARIERWEAEAKVFSAPAKSEAKSTKQTFEEMENEKAINDELAALKAAKENK